MQLAVMSASLNSAHESAGKTMSAYSHELVQCHSLQKIASCRGSVFLTTSNDHLALPSSEFELPNQISLVGVGMWLLPVIDSPSCTSSPVLTARSGRSP